MLNCRWFAKIIVLVASVAALWSPLSAQDAQNQAAKPRDFVLTLEGEIDAELAPVVGRMTALFYECYPKLVDRFENPKEPASRQVHVAFKRGLKAPAECSGTKITVSVDWLTKNPQDIGLLTHELVHVVQAYPSPDPSWLTEGLADYARHLYGPKEQPGWALPDRLTDKQSYQDSYCVTARFLLWLEKRHPGTVDKLHRQMQARAYAVGDFKSFTGRSVAELWDECVRDLGKSP